VVLAHMSLAPELHILMTGLLFVESPRWHDGRLWFSDWGTQEIIAVDLEGKSEMILRVPTLVERENPVARGPFCIDWLPDGRLLIVSGRDGILLRREHDGSLAPHANLSSLSGYPWNDIAVDSRGNAYVGCAGFDFPGGEFAPGVLAVVTPDGIARKAADGVAFPNGMVVTPDDTTLILAESYGKRLTAFDIGADGSLSNRRVWAEIDGYPDGICLDAENAIWLGDVPNKRCVRVREGGEVLQTINLDRGCFACALGGADGKTLFMLAAKWRSSTSSVDTEATGQVLISRAPAPGVTRRKGTAR
jgi:sugar lactone lactonase YvrE